MMRAMMSYLRVYRTVERGHRGCDNVVTFIEASKRTTAM